MQPPPKDVQIKKIQQLIKKKYGFVLSRDEAIGTYYSLLSFVEAQITFHLALTKND